MTRDTLITISTREKQILIRFFLAAKKLGRSKSDETAKRYAEEMANCVSDFLVAKFSPERLAEMEVTPEMAKAGADALFPDGEVRETADELEVMTRVFRAMVTGRDPRLPSFNDLCALLGRKP